MVELVIMSDRQKGLLLSVKECLPKAEQRACMVHIIRNMCSNKDIPKITQEDKQLLYGCSKKTNCIEMLKLMGMVFLLDEDIFSYLAKLDPTLWTNINMDKPTYGVISSSYAESFNSILKKKKGLPYPVFMKFIIDYSQKVIKERKELYKNMEGDYLSIAIKAISNLKSDYLTVEEDNLEENIAIVIDGEHRYLIKPAEKFCECGLWSNTKIPCSHLKSLLQHRSSSINNTDSIFNYISEIYKVDFMKNLYGQIQFDYKLKRGIKETELKPPKYLKRDKRKNRIKGRDETTKIMKK